jgi:intracellular septation protein A
MGFFSVTQPFYLASKNIPAAGERGLYNSPTSCKELVMPAMNLGRICLAIVAAAIVGSLTDWIFFGMLFHAKYMAYPEVWKKRAGGEGPQIMLASLAGLVASAAFIVLCAGLRVETNHAALKLAVAVWLAGAMLVIANEHVFMKLHPALLVSHGLGYLVRLVVSAAAYMYLGR